MGGGEGRLRPKDGQDLSISLRESRTNVLRVLRRRRGEPTAQAGLGLEQLPASSKPAFIGSAPGCLAELVKAISLRGRFLVLSSSCSNLLNPWRQHQLWSGCAQDSPRHSAPLGQDFRSLGSPLGRAVAHWAQGGLKAQVARRNQESGISVSPPPAQDPPPRSPVDTSFIFPSRHGLQGRWWPGFPGLAMGASLSPRR